MAYKYESEIHFFHVCRKFLKNNGIGLDSNEQVELKRITDASYLLSTNHEIEIQRLELREPVRILTYLLNASKDHEEFKENTDYYKYVHNMFIEILDSDEPSEETKNYLYANYYKPIRTTQQVYFKNCQAYKKFTEEFIELQKELLGKYGVYFLYNENKELVYIGKSASNLGTRIPSSLKEREAHFFSYALTKTLADAHIYEMYYITLLKPPLNTDGRTGDSPTMILPELTKSTLMKAFEDEVTPYGQI